MREDQQAVACRVPGQVDQDIDSVLPDQLGSRLVRQADEAAPGGHVLPEQFGKGIVFALKLDIAPSSHVLPEQFGKGIVSALEIGIGKDVELGAVIAGQHAAEGPSRGVISKVGGHVADPQAAVGVGVIRVRRLLP